MRVVFRRAAERALDRLPTDRRRQILSRIKDLAADPMRHGVNVKPLAGSDLFRLRVGDYRVLFSLDEAEEVLTVELIRTRGNIYKR
jgi:mRNA interferase RelE/StbE